jgi:hypothetical protein
MPFSNNFEPAGDSGVAGHSWSRYSRRILFHGEFLSPFFQTFSPIFQDFIIPTFHAGI